MKKLQEWTKGKGIVLIDRLFKILSKKTGETYKITHIPVFYQNKLGKFAGYWVVASSGTVYRANFILGSNTEYIVSLDKFSSSDNKLITPVETLSFEGFNIIQVYNCVLDWMRGKGEALKGNLKESTLHEGKWNDVMSQFLQQQPNWIKDSQSGKLDQALFFKSYKDFCKQNGVAGDPGPISYAMKTFQSTLVSGAAGNAGKAAAKGVAIPLVVAGAPSKPTVTNDDLIQKYAGGNAAEWNKFLADLEKPDTTNPMGVINHYREYIQDMAEAPDQTMNGVIAWGKGGTGKTHHATEALRSEGLIEGVHYKSISGALKGGVEALYGIMYDISQDGYQFMIIDDADNIFSDRFRTMMLHALDTDAKNRVFTCTERGVKTPEGKEIPVGEQFSVADCKFIFCTNKDVSSMDGAFKSRIRSFNFDFSDSEMLELIGQALENMLPDDPNLDKATKLNIFNMLSASLEKGIAKRIDFRVMTACLNAWSLAVNRKRDPVLAVSMEIKGAV